MLSAWLLLPLGLVLGWRLAKRQPAAQTATSDDSRETVEAIARAARADPALTELQFSLGHLFRNRGEVDRAIAVHQRLLERQDLSPGERDRAELELAQDYLKAGLMDRAEALLDRLVDQGVQPVLSLSLLLAVYEQAQDWPRAIEAAQRLQAARGSDAGAALAHYRCELAERQRAAGEVEAARRTAEQALRDNPGCVRVSLLLGALAQSQGEPRRALRALRRVPEQDPRFLGEALPRLRECCQALEEMAAYREFVEEARIRFPRATSVRVEHAKLLADDGEDAGAALAAGLREAPGWPAVFAWLELQSQLVPTQVEAVTEALRKLAAEYPRYRCQHCGLTPATLFWQCPSCKRWGSVVPAQT